MKKTLKTLTNGVIKTLYTMIILMIIVFAGFSQNVSINTTGTPPNADAGLDVDFQNKGVLIPRVALTSTSSFSPLAAHVAGMVVYNTATSGDVVPGFYYNNGTSWVPGFKSGIATGNMLYWNGLSWVVIPPGLPGQFLQVNASNIPVWAGSTGPYATITTTSATPIGTTTATTGGNITNDAGLSVLSRGVCYGLTSNPTTASSTVTAIPPIGAGSFSCNLSGLLSGTTYYVRAYSVNNTVTSYGPEISFMTLANIPTLAATTAASAITGNSATTGGNITADGGAAVTERGIVFGTTANPTITGTKVIHGSTGTGSFTSNLTGLSGGTLYYVRAYATNNQGTAYGAQIQFTTTVIPPTLTTANATNISGASATSGGSMTWNGAGYSNYQYFGVEYSINPDFSVPSTKVNTNSSNYSYTTPVSPNPWVTNLTGLAANTTYYIRSFFYVYRAGWSYVYGDVKSFTTTGPTAPLMGSTSTPTVITASTATSGGTITSDGGSSITDKGVCWGTSPSPTLGAGNFTSMGAGTGAFGSSIIGLTGNTTYYVRSYATNNVDTSYGPERSFTTCVTPAYNIGDQVGGGIVFYVNCDGSGLIAAPTDQATSVAWGCSGINIGTSANMGTGAANTNAILHPTIGCATRPIAASVARDYTGGGFTDWYLPSSQELYQMMLQHTLLNIGGQYWSSTDGTSTTVASIYYYINNIQATSATKNTSLLRVRAIRSFGPATLPTVTTTAITNIGAASATGGGNVTNDGGGSVSAGVCWSTNQNPTVADAHTSGDGTSIGSYISNLSGLVSGSMYYVRAYATNSAGTAYGSEVSFSTTSPTAPIITTEPITAQTDVSGTSGGTIVSDGGDPITVSGICWNTDGSPTTADSKTTDGFTSGTFISDATGLTAGTIYHIRAYATNGIDTGYGNEITFTPVPVGAPVITTDPIYSLVGAMAEGGGNLVTDGGNQITEWGLCWSTTANPTTSSNKVTDTFFLQNPGAANFYANMTGLTVGTTYHVRAYATNSAATSYGEDVTFTATAATLGQVLNTGNIWGIVYSVDGTGTHGLITFTYNAIGDTDWGCANSTSGATGTAVGDGKTNTIAILANIATNSCETSQGWGPGNLAPELINLYVGPGWHLPSKGELDLLWTNKGLDPDLDLNITDAATFNSFWSSSEVDATHAWSFDGTNWVDASLKTDVFTVWPVMSF